MPKLLIVDDEPLTVEMLETFLQISGYETVGALNGEDALTLLRLEQPELMILDLMLPDIEGYEVCRRIRSEPDFTSYAGLPVLILSARIEGASKIKAREAGADSYLTKPVRLPELIAELKRLLEMPRDRGSLSLTLPPAELNQAMSPQVDLVQALLNQPEPTPLNPAQPESVLSNPVQPVLDQTGLSQPEPTLLNPAQSGVNQANLTQPAPGQAELNPAPPTLPES